MSLDPPRFRPYKVAKGCGTCKHLQPGFFYTTCTAFPKGIPTVYTNGDDVHDVSLGDDVDSGIVWESMYEGVPTLDEYLDELDRTDPLP